MNLLFSDDDMYINFNAYDKTNKKILITGLPGSGKSTLADKLATAFNCEHVNLDRIRNNKYYTDEELKKNDPSIYKWLTTEYGKPRETFNDLPKDIRKKEWERCFYWILKQPGNMVIDGPIGKLIQIDLDLQKGYPIVIKGTSILKSMYRFIKREWNPGYNLSKFVIAKYLFKHICKYPSFKRELDKTTVAVLRHDPDIS